MKRTTISLLILGWVAAPSLFAEAPDAGSPAAAGELWVVDSNVSPEYPESALADGTMGCATVGYVIQSDGSTSNHKVLVVAPSEVFIEPTLAAARQLTYQPSADNSDRAPGFSTKTYTYVLGENETAQREGRERLQAFCETEYRKMVDRARAARDG